MKASLTIMIASLLTAALAAYGNNVTLTNAAMGTPGDGTVAVQFDIAWDNSWRDGINYDACWVFVKYSTDGGTNWGHATLSASGTNPTDYSGGTGTNLDVVVPSDKKGAFLQRAAAGMGSVSNTGAKLVWDFAADSVSPSQSALVSVFAIEMVYIPQGAFWIGNTNSVINDSFRAQNNTNSPIYISSTNAFTIYWGTGSSSASVPSSFPNGYDAFYMMKTEISQRQYCDFLNNLTAQQQGYRRDAALNYGNGRNYIKKTGDSPAFFGCDADNNAGNATNATRSLLNESNDGEWIACNDISWADGAAYADWAALRPFTELEFEKACRGPLPPVQDEYVWGNTVLDLLTSSMSDSATVSETPNRGNCNLAGCSPAGAYRCGAYAEQDSDRTQADAGYYGVLDLGGNVFERAVSAGNATGLLFTGLHGDGSLTADGYADTAGWPDQTATGAKIRGSSYNYNTGYSRTADRVHSSWDSLTARYPWDGRGLGWRGARTAP